MTDPSMASGMQAAHRYHTWTLDQIRASLGKRVLEVGAGYGTYTRLLADRELVVVIDVSDAYLRGLRRRFPDRPFVVRKMDISDPRCISSLSCHRLDTIICLNVLEHIEDDVGALRNMFEILGEREGKLALIVPAMPALYGRLDRLAGHHRRYTLPQLAERMGQAGFTLDKIRYFNLLGGIGWYLNAKLVRHRTLEDRGIGAQIRVFDSLGVPLARAVDFIAPFPFGQSLVCTGTARYAPEAGLLRVAEMRHDTPRQAET